MLPCQHYLMSAAGHCQATHTYSGTTSLPQNAAKPNHHAALMNCRPAVAACFPSARQYQANSPEAECIERQKGLGQHSLVWQGELMRNGILCACPSVL